MSGPRRGSILVMVLVVLLLLSLLAVTAVYRRRTDEQADSAFADKSQARCLAESGVQLAAAYVMENRAISIASNGAFYEPPYPGAFTDDAFRARRVGPGVVHLLRVAPADQLQGLGEPIVYGVADEAGKLNINAAGRDQWRQVLEAFEVRNVDAIIEAVQQWRGGRLDSSSAKSGGTSATGTSGNYNTEHAAVAFRNKSGFFETTEELLRVTLTDGRPAVPRALFFGTGGGDRIPPGGLGAYLTAWSVDNAGVFADGSKLVNINQSLAAPMMGTGGTGGGTGGQPQETGEQKLLRELQQARVDQAVTDAIMNARRSGTTFFSVGDLLNLPNIPRDRIVDTFDKTMTVDSNPGAVNVNTASEPVMRALLARSPTLAADASKLQAAAANLVKMRGSLGDRARNIGWLLEALTVEDFRIIARYATTRSFQYRVDSVGIPDDGRSFARVEAVIDVSLSRPRVLYYRDASWRGLPRLP